MSSDLARALLKRYQPDVLANRARKLITREVAKGCEPTIAPAPVELEPPYTSLRDDAPPVGTQPQVPWIQAPPEDPAAWQRMQVWISPEEKCSWRSSERFLKQVSGATQRVAIELVGNQDRVDQLLLLAEGVTQYQRVACFRLALHLKKAGVPQDIAVAALSAWAAKNRPLDGKNIITESELTGQTACAYTRSYRGCGCEDPAVKPFCEAGCPLMRTIPARTTPSIHHSSPSVPDGGATNSQEAKSTRKRP